MKGDFMKTYSEKINKLDKDIQNLCEKAKKLVKRADSQVDYMDYEHDIDEAIQLVEKAAKLDKKKRKYIVKQVKHEKNDLITRFIMDIRAKRQI
jgi:mRNA-degrading endonuclease RelE of RelBE toxin-antitoxin system